MKPSQSSTILRKLPHGRRMTSTMRQWLVGAGYAGTRSYFLRAGKYSAMQLVRAFTALLTAIFLIPSVLWNAMPKMNTSSSNGVNRFAPIKGVIVTTATSIKGWAIFASRELFRVVSPQNMKETVKYTLKTIHAAFSSLLNRLPSSLFRTKAVASHPKPTVNLTPAPTKESDALLLPIQHDSKVFSKCLVNVEDFFRGIWTDLRGFGQVTAKMTKRIGNRALVKIQDASGCLTSFWVTLKDPTKKVSEVKVIGERTSLCGKSGRKLAALLQNVKQFPIMIRMNGITYAVYIRNQGAKMWHSGGTYVRDKLHAGYQVVAVIPAEMGKTRRIVVSKLGSAGNQTLGAAVYFLRPIIFFVKLPYETYLSVVHAPLWVYLYWVTVLSGIGYLYYLIRMRYKLETWARSLKAHNKVRNGCQEFSLSDNVLRQCMEKLRAQIDLGLNPASRDTSTVKCYNTYVQDLPTGKEKGQFLALDLGGTNFRVLLITLNGRHFDMQSKIYVVPKNIMTGPGEMLFDHIASCLESFTAHYRVADKNLPLGFTFSFPLRQVGVKSGILMRWTKGFDCAETVGQDVVKLLNEAIRKRGSVKIDVVAVLNDTTGTLMSCAWKNHNCKIGVILGTGSNACYVEKIKNVIGFDGDASKPHVIVNTEWGAFGDNGELDFIRTPYDKEIDKYSVNPGKQLHEKMISGMYLGELVRLLVVKFTRDKVLFGGEASNKLLERWAFLTEYISEVESDPRGIYKQCRNVLGKMNILDPTDQDCSNLRYICESVSRRAAYLASAGVATLINKMEIPSVTIGVDGSLYRYHPHFHNLMHEKIPELCSPTIENLNINLMLSEDGSGRGAALIAACGSENAE